MTLTRYSSSLSDNEWKIIQPLVDRKSTYRNAGTLPKHSRRCMLDAIFYLLKTGCQWRDLPSNFPPWKAVYAQYQRWRDSGLFQEINFYLRQKLRSLLGKNAETEHGIADSQSVKTSEKKGSVGMMEGKRSRAANVISLLITQDF
jgi:transposase